MKVLDFGLAKALADEQSESALEDSPTRIRTVESAAG